MNKIFDLQKFYYNWWKNLDKVILLLILFLFTLGLFFSLVSTSFIASDKLNTNSLELFVNKIKKNGKFLFLSSSEIYSGLNGKIDESKVGTTNTNHPRACYIESKRGGETILNNYKNKLKFKPISIRLCLGFGPGVRKDDERSFTVGTTVWKLCRRTLH